jgi:glycine cleavage system H lipoate-binding protein
MESAANVTDALNMLKEDRERYSLVITDLMLPKISGMELLKTVQDLYSQLPVIVFTGYATTDKAIEAIRNGAFDFLPKPFSIEELLGVVKRSLKYLEIMDDQIIMKELNVQLTEIEKNNKVYFFGDHSWAKLEANDEVLVGAGRTFYRLLGEIKEIEFPNMNEEINQGNLCVKIITENDTIHIVRMPLSGIIEQFNPKLKLDKNLIQTDPFKDGWLIKISPTQMDKDGASVMLV